MDTFSRRNKLLRVLNNRRRDIVSNLAFEFNVSERTIRRDIEALSLDHPIYTMQGRNGGVFIVDNLNISGVRESKNLSQEEINALRATISNAKSCRELFNADDIKVLEQLLYSAS